MRRIVKILSVLMLIVMGRLIAAEYMYSIKDTRTGEIKRISKSQYERMKREEYIRKNKIEAQEREESYLTELAKREKEYLYNESIKYLEEKRAEGVKEEDGTKVYFIGVYRDDINQIVSTIKLRERKKKSEGILGFIKGEERVYTIIYEIIDIRLVNKRERELRNKFEKDVITVDLVEINSNIFNEYKIFDHDNYKNNEFVILEELIRDIENVRKLEIRGTYLIKRDRLETKKMNIRIEDRELEYIKEILSK